MGISEWLLASLAVVIGALVQGISGVGGGFIMVPLLAMIDLRLLPGALIFGSLSISGMMAWLERGHIMYRDTHIILLAIVPGAAVGAWLLSIIATEQLGILFGAMILVGVLITATGVHLKPNLRHGLVAGFVAGAMGASSGIGAPVVALLFQHRSGPELRSTLAYLYTVASTLIVIALALFGEFGGVEMKLGFLLMPGFLLGLFVSRQLVIQVDRGATRLVVLVVATISALSLIATSI